MHLTSWRTLGSLASLILLPLGEVGAQTAPRCAARVDSASTALDSALVTWARRWWSIPGLLIFTVVTVNAVLFVALLVRWGYFPVATG